MGRVEGKVAIVAGGGSRAPGIGNGRATAILLSREGARVALFDKSREAAEETKRMIDAEGGTSMVVEADVTDEASVRAAVKRTTDAWGSVSILANIVGIGGPGGTAVTLDIGAWDAAMRVNVTSMVIVSREVIPSMVAAGGGAIVNISSIAGLYGSKGHLFYTTSKGAVAALTKTMAADHGPEGIRVNCIAPGWVYTPMVQDPKRLHGAMSAERREARRLAGALKSEGTGWDVGHAALFLLSDEARWITGVVLPVDAGVTAVVPTP